MRRKTAQSELCRDYAAHLQREINRKRKEAEEVIVIPGPIGTLFVTRPKVDRVF